MNMPFNVSVVIPTFNRASRLEVALESVLAQSLPPLEVIVVDDGSTDETRELVSAKFAGHVSYYYQPNRGVSAARNLGIQRSTGNWIAFLDSDDEWLPDKLQRQVDALQSNSQYRFCHTDEIWIRNGRRVNPANKHQKYGGYIFERCLPLCVISPSSVLLHRDCFNEIGCFDEGLPACEDYDFWLRYCARYPVLYVDTPLLVKHGGHKDQLSRCFWGMDRFRIQALVKLLQSDDLSQQYQHAVIKMLEDKCNILDTGARKHGNQEMINFCHKVRRFIGAMDDNVEVSSTAIGTVAGSRDNEYFSSTSIDDTVV